MQKKLSVIIPAYNEEENIKSVLAGLVYSASSYDITKEIIIINDCSTDQTQKAVEDFIEKHPLSDIQLINQKRNRGKGASVRAGIENASGDILVIQDADLEYDPMEFDIMLAPFIKNQADVVYGSRFMGGNPHRVLFFWHSIGNRFLTFLSNILTNLNLTDMETCYKMFRRELLQSIELKENRFGFEPEITAKISRIPNLKIYEVGISYYGRTYQEGKKIKWKDGFRAIYCILKYNIFQ
ncbi:MAG TPA: glycosyltransferase family 2 protein [Puia sp.]|nr:glycosyltransferase family 2 protein [Puia sp.]